MEPPGVARLEVPRDGWRRFGQDTQPTAPMPNAPGRWVWLDGQWLNILTDAVDYPEGDACRMTADPPGAAIE